jgi:hypothetical protein
VTQIQQLSPANYNILENFWLHHFCSKTERKFEMVFCQMAEYYLVRCRSVGCYLVEVSFGQVSFGQTLFGQVLFGQTLLFIGGILKNVVCTKNIQLSPVKFQLRPPAVNSPFFVTILVIMSPILVLSLKQRRMFSKNYIF